MRDQDLDEKLNKAFEALSSLSRLAYRDVFLLSNQVLSKNPFASRFLNHYLRGKDIPGFSLGTILRKMSMYYLSSIGHFILYFLRYAVYHYCGIPHDTKCHRSELTIVDTFFLCDRICQSGSFQEAYFQGLDAVLQDVGVDYAYLPVYYNCHGIRRFNHVHKILKKDKIPLLSEFHILKKSDLWRILLFIMIYPWRVWLFVTALTVNNKDEEMAAREMIHTLDQVTFYSYSRYLQGKRISEWPIDKIKVISWFENQVIDKCLYKGLRTNSRKVFIYGAQLFLYSKMDLNIIVDEGEKEFGIIPDQIVVNGPHFIPKDTGCLHYKVGPSLRYREQFRTAEKKATGGSILVLLSYSQEDNVNILRILSATKLSSQALIIKPHPATSVDDIKGYLKKNWKLEEENLYALLQKIGLVIGSASGSLLEAASMGIPVIRIKNLHGFDYQILPELGEGIIWDEVEDAEKLENVTSKYTHMSDHEISKMMEIAATYKNQYFCEPTREQIVKSFDL